MTPMYVNILLYVYRVLFSECESLLRKILVLDSSRRFNLEQIKNHPWMTAEVSGRLNRTELDL